MPVCAVYGCNNHSDKAKESNLHFHRFPRKRERLNEWIHLCRRQDKINVQNACVCSIHFTDEDYMNLMEHRLMNVNLLLKKNAIPSQHLPKSVQQSDAHLGRSERSKAREKNKTLKEEQEKEELLLELINDLEEKGETIAEIVPGEVTTEENWEQKCRQLEEENKKLKEQVATEENIKHKKLEEEIKRLKAEVAFHQDASTKYMKMLQSMFTPGQIQRLLNADKRTFWEEEDIAAAITLRSMSPRCYTYLKEVKKIPLPCESTLRNWIKELKFEPGILGNVLELMGMKSHELSQWERLVVLTFDEMYLSPKIDIDKSNERVWGPHKACLVVMARGLIGNWKQPVFYNFDVKLRDSLFFELVTKLYAQNYIVVALTCDLGPNNNALWKDLGINYPYNNGKTYCLHPCDATRKIFIFADVPHLLKLIRNNLLDHGFIFKKRDVNNLINKENLQLVDDINNDVVIDKALLRLAVAHNCELTPLFKITPAHLNCVNTARQNVSLAAQLLSRSMAVAIKFLGDQEIVSSVVSVFGNRLLNVINDWFDMLNSYTQYGKCNTANAFGINLEAQRNLLDEMSNLMLTIRVGKRESLLPFQKGIILTNMSVLSLFINLQEYDMKYILTARLNQDVLENFFSTIRSMGATHDHPCALNFKYRLKWYLLGRQSTKLLNCKNNTLDKNSDNKLIDLQTFSDNGISIVTEFFCNDLIDDNSVEDGKIADSIEMCLDVEIPVINVNYDNITEDQSSLLEVFEKETTGAKIKEEGLKYLSGFVAHKFKKKYSELGIHTKDLQVKDDTEFDWLLQLSRGYLVYPSDRLLKAADIMNRIFENFHGSNLKKVEKIIINVCKLAEKALESKNCLLPFEIIQKFVKTRTYIRLREMNRNILSECRKKTKKMKKINN